MRTLARTLPLILLCILAGCSTLVERAEKAHWTAFTTTDAFLNLERSLDDAGMRDPWMHQVAETLRAEAPPVLLDSFDLIQSYKAEQTEDGKIQLQGAVNMLKELTKTANHYLP